MNNVYSKTGKLVKQIYFGATLIWESLYALFESRVEADGGIFDNSYTDISNDGQSLLLTPNAYKAGKLYSALPKDGSGDFTVERNSTATRVNKDGLIEIIPINTPRIDYSTGEPMLIVEGQSTNLILWSKNFNKWNSVAYTNILSTIEVAPDGTNTAYLIQTANTTGWIFNSLTCSPNTDYTFSIYIKSSNCAFTFISLYDETNSIFIVDQAQFTINDEWKRIEITCKTPSNCTSLRYYAIRNIGSADKEFTIWGAQLDEGSKATSYITTNGSTVTRLADVITTTPPNGTTQIIETIDGVENIITEIPPTYQLPVGKIEKVEML